MIRRTAHAALLASLIAGCQAQSPLSQPSMSAQLVTETMLLAGASPFRSGQTVMLTLEPAGATSAGADVAEPGTDRLEMQVDAAGRFRFDLEDENGERHTVEVLDAAGKSLMKDEAEGAEPILELQPGRYTLVLRHAGGGTEQVVFIHERLNAGMDVREIELSINHAVGLNLSGVNLQGANLAGVTFIDCNLIGANLRGADLTHAAMIGGRSEGVDTTGAKKEGYTVLSWSEERVDTTIYKVVVNHEEQYSIWPADRENPLGWNDAGKQGLKAECLAYIEEVWTDMRPKSLREKMARMGAW